MIPHSRPWINEADREAVERQLLSGMVAEGEVCRRFEAELASALDLPGGVATSSGSAAFRLCLEALEIGPGDEVVLPSYVCDALDHTIRGLGATPVFCDVDELWTLTPGTVERVLSTRTRAVVAVHTFGIAADMAGLRALDVPLIEDCCQALGAGLPGGGSAGSAGRLSFFSFHGTKCLTTGEGGFVASRDPELLRRIQERKALAGAPRLSDLQAALGLSQLRRYAEMLKRRHQVSECYLRELPLHATERTRRLMGRSIWFRFPVTIREDFDRVRQRFEERGVAVRRGVDTLLHRRHGRDDAAFPGATACFASTCSIPLYPALDEAGVEQVCEAARHVLSGG